MNQLSKNSAVSLGVMFAGLFLSFVGPFIEPSRSLFTIGQMLIPFGLIQAHFGAFNEFKQTERRLFYVLGILVVVLGLFTAYLGLRDYQASWPWLVVLVIATLIIQLLVSIVWTWIWNVSEKLRPKVD